jgi:hypothetical protein
MKMLKVIIEEIRVAVNSSDLSDEEKYQRVLSSAMPISAAKFKIIAQSEALILHVAKRKLFPQDIHNWEKDIATKMLERISRIKSDLDNSDIKNLLLEGKNEDHEMLDYLEDAVEAVTKKNKKAKPIQFTEQQLLQTWTTFVELFIQNYEQGSHYTEHQVRAWLQ